MIKRFFELRGELPKKTALIIEVAGFVFFFLLWYALTTIQIEKHSVSPTGQPRVTVTKIIPESILPNPVKVITSFKELHLQEGLVRNTFYSIQLNVAGYLEAVIISIIVGFGIGLFPVFRCLFSRYINASRFLPLTALTGIFIAWFGIDSNMKIQFLAFGIIVYMVPVVIQRIDEVEKVYLQTGKTLGANKWQMISQVYFPATFSKLFDDIRVLVAISWTYIIVAELVNRTSGIGAMAYTCARKSRMDEVFAILLVIILIGFIQDKLFVYIDKQIFRHKYC